MNIMILINDLLLRAVLYFYSIRWTLWLRTASARWWSAKGIVFGGYTYTSTDFRLHVFFNYLKLITCFMFFDHAPPLLAKFSDHNWATAEIDGDHGKSSISTTIASWYRDRPSVAPSTVTHRDLPRPHPSFGTGRFLQFFLQFTTFKHIVFPAFSFLDSTFPPQNNKQPINNDYKKTLRPPY